MVSDQHFLSLALLHQKGRPASTARFRLALYSSNAMYVTICLFSSNDMCCVIRWGHFTIATHCLHTHYRAPPPTLPLADGATTPLRCTHTVAPPGPALAGYVSRHTRRTHCTRTRVTHYLPFTQARPAHPHTAPAGTLRACCAIACRLPLVED